MPLWLKWRAGGRSTDACFIQIARLRFWPSVRAENTGAQGRSFCVRQHDAGAVACGKW
jgi:hypothetical protein